MGIMNVESDWIMQLFGSMFKYSKIKGDEKCK